MFGRLFSRKSRVGYIYTLSLNPVRREQKGRIEVVLSLMAVQKDPDGYFGRDRYREDILGNGASIIRNSYGIFDGVFVPEGVDINQTKSLASALLMDELDGKAVHLPIRFLPGRFIEP